MFGLINEPKVFNTWNPYARKDPQIKLRYEGAASGGGDFEAGLGNLKTLAERG